MATLSPGGGPSSERGSIACPKQYDRAMATHLLVGNPAAQSGKNGERIERAMSALRARGAAPVLLPTRPNGETVAAVRDALDAATAPVVIAMGGDGTFREVAAGLMESRTPERVALGILPTGTANDQGRSFGLDASPDALEDNVAVILEGHEVRLDAGLLSSAPSGPTYFFDSAGWGLSARILSRRNRDRRLVDSLGPLKEVYRDHAVYAGALLSTFLESYVVTEKFDAIAVLDGERVELPGLTDLIVKNTRVYAGAWVLDRTARSDDGAFEVVPFRGRRDWVSKAIVDIDGSPLNEELVNRIGIEHSRPMRASRIELAMAAPAGGSVLAAQLDGEEWPVGEQSASIRIDVVPRAIRLIVPIVSCA